MLKVNAPFCSIGTFLYHDSLASLYLKAVERPSWPPVKVASFIDVNLSIVNRWHEDSANESVTIMYDDITERLSRVKFILLTGQPGSGKSTLLTKFSQDWAKGLLLELKLLFSVSLRQLNHFDDRTLANLLHAAYPSLNAVEIAYLEGTITRVKGKNVVFVLDGLDEYFSRSTNDVVIQLLNVYSTFLPDALIVASSRHNEPHLFVGMQVEVKGFSNEQVIQYVHSYFEKEEKAQELIIHLEKYSHIMEIAHLPLHCAVLAFFHDVASVLPETITDFYKCFTLSFFCSVRKQTRNMLCLTSFDQLSPEGKEEFGKVCKLAYAATLNRNEFFLSPEFQNKSGRTGNNFGSVVITYYFRNTILDKSNTFLLRQFQEYLAAVYISQLSQSEQLNLILKDTHCPYTVYKFLCGMTNFTLSGSTMDNIYQAIYSVVRFRNDCAGALIPCACESRQQYPYYYLSEKWNSTLTFARSEYFSTLTPCNYHELASLLNNPQFQLAVFHHDFVAPTGMVQAIFSLVDNPALSLEVCR